MSNIITIKENAPASRPNLGLEKEGRSKFPNCYDLIQPAQGLDGRYKTGLDEDSMEINAIRDSKQREAKKKEIRKERESLEALLSLDLSANSKYWDTYFVELNPKKPLNLTNPSDRIKYYVLMASGSVVPSQRDVHNMDYKDAKYVVSIEHEDVADKVSKKKRYAQALADLLKLMETPDKAILVGRYLGLGINNTTPQSNMYDTFQTYLDNDEKVGSIDFFNSALNKTAEELNVKVIFDDSIKYNVIRLRDGYYQRGNVTYGKTIAEVVSFLTDVKNSGELLSIQDEIEQKRKFG